MQGASRAKLEGSHYSSDWAQETGRSDAAGGVCKGASFEMAMVDWRRTVPRGGGHVLRRRRNGVTRQVWSSKGGGARSWEGAGGSWFDHAALRAAWRAAGMRTGWTSRSSLMSLAILVDICAMVGRASGSNARQSRMRSWRGGGWW